ncbi:MAG TPA: hypothetical protein PKD85_07960 [Saprospiraceae bacterium]|nr:hypothetical protein [Saprospiraceae bacterium]
MTNNLFYISVFLFLMLTSCSEQKLNKDQTFKSEEEIDKTESTVSKDDVEEGVSLELSTNIQKNVNVSCWKGLIDAKIAVELCYQFFDDIVFGEILYPQSKTPIPIQVIGTIAEDSKYIELREFDRKGLITGLISGIPLDDEFNPEWFNPSTQKARRMTLVPLDTLVQDYNINGIIDEVKGQYYYAYGPKGYSGDLEVLNKVGNEIQVRMLSTTGETSGYNIAELELTSAILNKNLAKVNYPYNDECKIYIAFYKNFAYVKQAFCDGEFGHNATLEGIYYKLKI